MPAHHHAGDRVGTVLQGTWQFGFGTQFDKAKLKTLPVGSVYTEPANGPHFAMRGNEPVIVLITEMGPTDTVQIRRTIRRGNCDSLLNDFPFKSAQSSASSVARGAHARIPIAGRNGGSSSGKDSAGA